MRSRLVPAKPSSPAVLAFAVSVAALATLVAMNSRTFWLQTDAVVYRDAGASLWAHDGGLYRASFGPAHLPFTYPPFAAVIFSIGSRLPFAGWQFLLAAADIALLALAAVGTLRVTGSQRALSRGLLAASICLWLEPIDMTFHFGQLNLVIVALVVAEFSGVIRGPWRGLGVGLAAGLKLTPLIFIPYLWLTGRKREAYGGLAFFDGCRHPALPSSLAGSSRRWSSEHWGWLSRSEPIELV
jgi:alpha-1,2-mannosyltransferase